MFISSKKLQIYIIKLKSDKDKICFFFVLVSVSYIEMYDNYVCTTMRIKSSFLLHFVYVHAQFDFPTNPQQQSFSDPNHNERYSFVYH